MFEKLIRKHLLDLKPYSSAREEYTGKLGVFLDANENPLGSATEADYNRYPDPLQRQLKSTVAAIKGVEVDQIFLGNGSDEPIDLLIRAFCEPEIDHILICPPTYGMYKVSADINKVAIKEVPLTSAFKLDQGALLQAISPNTKIIFFCSPNNPTGNLLDPGVMLEVMKATQGIVVIDEAYIDFIPDASMLKELKNHTRLVVLQTFSKAWGLAGLRLGMAFAHPGLISILNRIKPPYNISAPTQLLAAEALNNRAKMLAMVRTILDQKAWLVRALARLSSVREVYPSDTNFILVKTTDAKKLYMDLIDQKVIIRNRSNVYLCGDCLRVSVGTQAENRQLIAAWKAVEKD